MEKSGIEYDENGLPTSTNGSWQQTSVYLLNQLINHLKSSGDTATLSIIKTEVLPKQVHIELYDPHPLNYPKPNIEVKKVIVQPKTEIIKIAKKDLYTKCCGAYNPGASYYVKCMKRVDECYEKVKQCKGNVYPGDMTAYTIRLDDCGCKYDWRNDRGGKKQLPNLNKYPLR